MGTFTSAITVQHSTFNTSLPSSNGSVQGTLVYQAPAARKVILNITNLYNNLTHTTNLLMAISKKCPHSGLYFDVFTFNVSGGGAANNPAPVAMTQSEVQRISNSGFSGSNFISDNVELFQNRIILLPDDRLTCKGGGTANGSSLRICGQLEIYI